MQETIFYALEKDNITYNRNFIRGSLRIDLWANFNTKSKGFGHFQRSSVFQRMSTVIDTIAVDWIYEIEIFTHSRFNFPCLFLLNFE